MFIPAVAFSSASLCVMACCPPGMRQLLAAFQTLVPPSLSSLPGWPNVWWALVNFLAQLSGVLVEGNVSLPWHVGICSLFLFGFPATLRFRTCVSASFACFTNRRDKNCDTHLFRSIFCHFLGRKSRLTSVYLHVVCHYYYYYTYEYYIIHYLGVGGKGLVLFCLWRFFQGTLTVLAFASFKVDMKYAEK